MGSYNGDKPYIFISYSHKDTAVVMKIVDQMINDGYRVWYDDGIKPGAEWDDYIATKINDCGYFIAFLSENYLESENCKDELNYSRDHVANILLVYLSPVNLPAGMEMRLGRNQAIHAYNYEKKTDFFNKFYLSRGISEFRNEIIDEVTVVEESNEILEEPSLISVEASPKVSIKENKIEEPKVTKEKVIKEEKINNKKSIIPGFRSGKKFHMIVASVIYIFSVIFIAIVLGDIYTSIGTKYAAFDVPRGIYIIIGYILIFLYTSNFGHILNRMFKFEKRPMWLQILIIVLGDIIIAALMFALLVGTEVLLLVI